MSKAFTRENDGSSETVRPPPRIEPGSQRRVTAEGFEALREELARLDPSSNRALQLAAVLPGLVVAEPPEDGIALFGSWVRIEDEDGATRRFRIVGPDEADAKAGLLSVESPLARALLGKHEGETVTVELPRGPAELTLLRARSTNRLDG
jgi:transcription elongation factor GreB